MPDNSSTSRLSSEDNEQEQERTVTRTPSTSREHTPSPNTPLSSSPPSPSPSPPSDPNPTGRAIFQDLQRLSPFQILTFTEENEEQATAYTSSGEKFSAEVHFWKGDVEYNMHGGQESTVRTPRGEYGNPSSDDGSYCADDEDDDSTVVQFTPETGSIALSEEDAEEEGMRFYDRATRLLKESVTQELPVTNDTINTLHEEGNVWLDEAFLACLAADTVIEDLRDRLDVRYRENVAEVMGRIEGLTRKMEGMLRAGGEGLGGEGVGGGVETVSAQKDVESEADGVSTVRVEKDMESGEEGVDTSACQDEGSELEVDVGDADVRVDHKPAEARISDDGKGAEDLQEEQEGLRACVVDSEGGNTRNEGKERVSRSENKKHIVGKVVKGWTQVFGEASEGHDEAGSANSAVLTAQCGQLL